MNETNTLTPDPQVELVHLQEQLQVRDQLVQQLSEELFRLIQTSSYFNPDAEATLLPGSQSEEILAALPAADDHWENDANELAAKDAEIFQLRHIIDQFKDRCQLLENVIQEFPEIYRRKFAERLQPIRSKIATLQQENRTLKAELQLAQQRLAIYENANATAMELSHLSQINSP